MIIEEFRNIKIAYVRRTGAYGSENQKLERDLSRVFSPNNHIHPRGNNT